MLRLAGLYLAFTLAFTSLHGCTTNPDGSVQMSEADKLILQEVATIAVRRALNDSPRWQEKSANIRAVAVKLQTFTSETTISGLKAAVEREVDGLGLNPVDRADAQSLLNIFAALLTERLGKDELDADALVKVNEFVSMIVQALPPPA